MTLTCPTFTGKRETGQFVRAVEFWQRSDAQPDNRRLYPRLLAEFRRVLAPGGLMFLLTAESRLMREALEQHKIALNSMLAVTVLGASAWIYVCRVTASA